MQYEKFSKIFQKQLLLLSGCYLRDKREKMSRVGLILSHMI